MHKEKNLFLVLDDDKEFLNFFEKVLIHYNGMVDIFNDEQKAIDALTNKKYDIIFCDIFKGPKETFLNFILSLGYKKHLNNQSLLMLVSGIADKKYLQKIKTNNPSVFDYHLKPVEKINLLASFLSANEYLGTHDMLKLNLENIDIQSSKLTEHYMIYEGKREHIATKIITKVDKGATKLEELEEEQEPQIPPALEVFNSSEQISFREKKGANNELLWAISKGDKEEVLKVIESSPELIHKLDKIGKSVLHYAVLSNRKFILKELIKAGAKPDISDQDNITPLLDAIFLNSVDLIQILIDEGCSVNAGALSPLELCYHLENIFVFKKLLFAGASPTKELLEMVTEEEFKKLLTKFS